MTNVIKKDGRVQPIMTASIIVEVINSEEPTFVLRVPNGPVLSVSSLDSLPEDVFAVCDDILFQMSNVNTKESK